ncbi:transport protein Sec24-like CEF [Tanacetum coccineum]
MKWMAATGVLCDRNVLLKLKGKFYRVAIRPAMLYGSECWPITKALANRVEVAELRMLRWTCGRTLLDMIPNGVYRALLEVETIINKMREGRLRWFGHVRRRPQSSPVRRVEALVVDGLRRRGRPKLRWEDRVKHDMKELLLSEDMTSDRNEWRARISVFMLALCLCALRSKSDDIHVFMNVEGKCEIGVVVSFGDKESVTVQMPLQEVCKICKYSDHTFDYLTVWIVLAYLLEISKQIGENNLIFEVVEYVVAKPAYFTHLQRRISLDAATGGIDFDAILKNPFAHELIRDYEFDVVESASGPAILRASCEKLKIKPSAQNKVGFSLKRFIEDINITCVMRRDKFHQLTSQVLQRVTDLCSKALNVMIGEGLGEHLAPNGRLEKIPNEDRGRFGVWFANRIWGWRWPPRPKPSPLPFLLTHTPQRLKKASSNNFSPFGNGDTRVFQFAMCSPQLALLLGLASGPFWLGTSGRIIFGEDEGLNLERVIRGLVPSCFAIFTFEPLTLSLTSMPSCDLESLTNILILCLILKASNQS